MSYYMYKVICKDLGFDCDFIIKIMIRKFLQPILMKHLQVGSQATLSKKRNYRFY